MIQILPVHDIGEVRPGDDLAAVILAGLAASGLTLASGDILVVTQKIVSKAEGRYVALASVTPGHEAQRLAELTAKDPRLVELVLSESQSVVRAVPNVLITRHRLGLVMANAGIYQSNLGSPGGDNVLLLPSDPDASARHLAAAIENLVSVSPAIVISDSFGRPWRNGVVNVAIGASGLPALLDRRGDSDRDGRRLEVTQIALGDMIATAAGLAMGEASEGIPVAIVRGYQFEQADRPATDLVRPLAADLFQ
jgi:coenzyme F420-0:L-glutamate ligase/coenzyme F420-1:gamma-L-glutamate ligase